MFKFEAGKWYKVALIGAAGLLGALAPMLEAAETVVNPSATLTGSAAESRSAATMMAEDVVLSAAAAKLPSPEIPFRTTMDPTDYDSLKNAAKLGPSIARPAAPDPNPLAPPTIKVMNISGVNQTESGGGRPPDTHGAQGLSEYCQIVNSKITCHKLSSPFARALDVSLASFFNYTAQTLFDPRIEYDQTWDRWIVYAEAFAESATVQRLFWAVSKGQSPNAGWWVYSIDIDLFDNNDFWDFGQLGVTQDAITFNANIFNAGFQGARLFAIAKARLYNGLGFSVPVYSGLVGTLAPPVVLDQNANTFLVAATPVNSTVTKYTLSNAAYPNNQTLTSTTIPVTAYTVPPNAAQCGTAVTLDSLDSRFVNRSTQIGNSLFQVHTIEQFGTFAIPRWYEFDTVANTVLSSGNFWRSGNSHDWMASIGATVNKDVFVVWSSASTTVCPQVVISGKEAADAAIALGGSVCKTSPVAYTPTGLSPERWGDYSSVALARSNPTKNAAVTAEWAEASNRWGSQICRIGF